MGTPPVRARWPSPGGGRSWTCPPALNVVIFREADGRTTLELLVETATREQRDAILDPGMEAGMQEQLDLLEELVASLG